MTIAVTDEGGFRFLITFGDKAPGAFGSSWTVTLAATAVGESFLDTLARARDVFDVLVHGKRIACDIDVTFGDFLRKQLLFPGWIRSQVERTLDGTFVNDESRPAAEPFLAEAAPSLRAGARP